jgi:hypothetical protein
LDLLRSATCGEVSINPLVLQKHNFTSTGNSLYGGLHIFVELSLPHILSSSDLPLSVNMATSSCQPQSVAFLTTSCISDVKSYTFPGCAKEDEDFGIDPPVMKIVPLHVLPIYSAPALDDFGFDPPTLRSRRWSN